MTFEILENVVYLEKIGKGIKFCRLVFQVHIHDKAALDWK